MHEIDLILTLTLGLGVALVFGYVTHRIGLSPIVGYLLAGIAVGPHTPGFVANPELAEQFAEVGVILLLFGVGLHFHLDDLLAVRGIAIPGAVVQSGLATGLTALLVHALGWDWTSGIVLGLAISVASTVVLVRVLTDARELHTKTGHIAVGWLVVEDLFTVIVLVLLPALWGEASADGGDVAVALGLTGLKIAALVAIVLLLGRRGIPWLLERIAATRSRELFTLSVLVVALGIAVGSTMLFGVSMALGAFLAGMIVGRSDFSLRAASEALPMRDAFAVLFFVSMGMLLDPRALVEEPALVAATLAVILIGKPLAALAIVLVLGHPLRVALGVSAALAQIGEFSFILGSLALDLGILPPEATHALVAGAILSISLNPLVYRLVDPTVHWIARRPRLARFFRASEVPVPPPIEDEPARTSRHRAIVVGYGPIGRTVTRLLRENEIDATVVELNLETVRRLRAEGVPVVYGDATHRDTMTAAGVATAGSLILSADVVRASEPIIRLARELNPGIRILARSAYVRDLADLRRAGADRVFSGEGEVALALTEAILRGLGATPEQIDRERDRVRAELFGESEKTERDSRSREGGTVEPHDGAPTSQPSSPGD